MASPLHTEMAVNKNNTNIELVWRHYNCDSITAWNVKNQPGVMYRIFKNLHRPIPPISHLKLHHLLSIWHIDGWVNVMRWNNFPIFIFFFFRILVRCDGLFGGLLDTMSSSYIARNNFEE